MATARAQEILNQLQKKWDQENRRNKNPTDISNLDPKVIEAVKSLDSAKKPEPDFMQMAREHKLKYGGTLVDAMRWVDQNCPHKRREYLRKHNPHLSDKDF